MQLSITDGIPISATAPGYAPPSNIRIVPHLSGLCQAFPVGPFRIAHLRPEGVKGIRRWIARHRFALSRPLTTAFLKRPQTDMLHLFLDFPAFSSGAGGEKSRNTPPARLDINLPSSRGEPLGCPRAKEHNANGAAEKCGNATQAVKVASQSQLTAIRERKKKKITQSIRSALF